MNRDSLGVIPMQVFQAAYIVMERQAVEVTFEVDCRTVQQGQQQVVLFKHLL